MNPLLENAIDSLVLGIGFYINEDIDRPHKHSILTIFHSIELLLKERLYRENKIFIYKNIDTPINDNSLTVGMKDIFGRFKNLGVNLDTDDRKTIEELQKRRNRIEHHHYNEDENDSLVIGKSLRFVYFFMKKHLDDTLESHLDNETYNKVREIILKYEERLEEAKQVVNKLTTPVTKDDLCGMPSSANCPECGHDTVVIGGEKNNYCYFCLEEQDISPCDSCDWYFPSDELNDLNHCDDCYTDLVNR